MAAFEYLALDPRGREQKGLIEADSPRQARQLLREKQWAPLEVKQAKSKEDVSRGGFSFGRGLSARDLALVTRQLATLVQAALPIEEALRGAEIVLVATEWKEFQELDPEWARTLVAGEPVCARHA